MQETRPKAEAGRHPLSIPHNEADLLQCVGMELVALDVCKESAVVAGAKTAEMLPETHRQRAAGFCQCLRVRLIGENLETVVVKVWRFGGQLTGLFIGRGEFP